MAAFTSLWHPLGIHELAENLQRFHSWWEARLHSSAGWRTETWTSGQPKTRKKTAETDPISQPRCFHGMFSIRDLNLGSSPFVLPRVTKGTKVLVDDCNASSRLKGGREHEKMGGDVPECVGQLRDPNHNLRSWGRDDK